MSLEFATIEGNAAATLDTSWVTGTERDSENEEDQYSRNPLATGLLSDSKCQYIEDCTVAEQIRLQMLQVHTENGTLSTFAK